MAKTELKSVSEAENDGKKRQVTAPKREMTAHERAIAESRTALDHPLELGQQFFEAPDGYVIVGEADKPHAWYRQGNGGKGCWINPRR